jgi:hypothetical protein
LSDDWNDGFPGHISTQDEGVDFIELAATDKFLPTDLRTVYVRGVKEFHLIILSFFFWQGIFEINLLELNWFFVLLG